MDHLINFSLSLAHLWFEVGMLKVLYCEQTIQREGYSAGRLTINNEIAVKLGYFLKEPQVPPHRSQVRQVLYRYVSMDGSGCKKVASWFRLVLRASPW